MPGKVSPDQTASMGSMTWVNTALVVVTKSLRKHAYSNILKILQPKKEKF